METATTTTTTFIIVDMEALYSPAPEKTTTIPVSEISWVILQKNEKKEEENKWSILQRQHSLLRPIFSWDSLSKEEQQSVMYVYDRITGLDPHYVHHYGVSETMVIPKLAEIHDMYPDAIWVARGPDLENRIFTQWGLSEKIHVKEILEYLPEKERCIFFYSEGRPVDLRQQASTCQCSHHFPYDSMTHPSPDVHCAATDVMEECLWLMNFA